MYVVKWVEIDQNVVIPNIRRKRKVDGDWRESPNYVFFFFWGVGVSGNVTPRSTPRGEIRLI